MEFLKIKNETADEFQNIAQILFDEYVIQTKDTFYRLVEIEFYWQSSTHKDVATYGRNHINPKAGEWFFHYSGVDIALRNEQNDGHGGILLRSIYDLNTGKTIKGPLVCAMKLFSGANAFTETIQTKIIHYKKFEKSIIKRGPRFGLGKIPKQDGSDKFEYAFKINP